MTLDTQTLYLLNSIVGKSPLFDGGIVFLASYLAYLLPVALCGLVLFSGYTKREKWELLLVAFTSAIIARAGITEIIRFFYHRPRPFLEHEINTQLTETSWSFPSGHATFFFALSTAVYLYNKKWGIGFFVATILMTISRVIVGVHYPSDILGGAVIGITVATATFHIVRKFWLRRTGETVISTY
ncbi:phosphatase PAP2 family protein [Candidatus Kaiserbacteria bacterium]|nr:phosphatase PAP2 family protein [Candidatus Kaiserbacteria bacterium]